MVLMAVVLAIINVIVCLMVAKSDCYTRQQVWLQWAIVWLLPLLGAVLVGVFLRAQRAEPSATRKGGAAHDNWQNAENPVQSD